MYSLYDVVLLQLSSSHAHAILQSIVIIIDNKYSFTTINDQQLGDSLKFEPIRGISQKFLVPLVGKFKYRQHDQGEVPRFISGRWQAPAAVLPEGPKDQGESHSRARRAREWLKPASPRARRARGRAKPSACFGACQCYYMFFTIQPKIAIFVAQFKYLNDGQYA